MPLSSISYRSTSPHGKLMILGFIFWFFVAVIIAAVGLTLGWVGCLIWTMGFWWVDIIFVAVLLVALWWMED